MERVLDMMRNRALRRVCRRIALTAMPVLLLTIVVGCPFLDFFNPPPPPPPAELMGEIGRGGMGVVIELHDTDLG